METYEVKVAAVRFPREEVDRQKRDSGEARVWYILECDFCPPAKGGLTAKGDMIFRPAIGEYLKLTGDWHVYNGQREFRFKGAEVNMPVAEDDMLHYACELTPGFGPAMESAIWKLKGDGWREVEAGDIKGLTPGKVAALRQTIEELRLKESMHTSIAWLIGKGATPNLAVAAWAKWEADMVGVVTANCYRLAELPNYGFAAVDREIRRNFGIADNDPRRIDAAIVYCMGILTEAGNTAISWAELDAELCSRLPGVDRALVINIIRGMFAENRLYGFPERQMLALGAHVRAEQDIFAFCGRGMEATA